jgi:hypothetical protein
MFTMSGNCTGGGASYAQLRIDWQLVDVPSILTGNVMDFDVESGLSGCERNN